MHVEKGHCHLSIPKLEVLLDLNNIPDTKADLASLVQRVTRRPQKVCTLTMEDIASVTTWPLVSHTLRCRDMMWEAPAMSVQTVQSAWRLWMGADHALLHTVQVSIRKPLPISESEPARIAAATPHSSTIDREHKKTEAADLQQSTADTFRTRASPQHHIDWKDNPRCRHCCRLAMACIPH